jgi:hypothetical protein
VLWVSVPYIFPLGFRFGDPFALPFEAGFDERDVLLRQPGLFSHLSSGQAGPDTRRRSSMGRAPESQVRTPDSPLEEDGFEPSVPLVSRGAIRSRSARREMDSNFRFPAMVSFVVVPFRRVPR